MNLGEIRRRALNPFFAGTFLSMLAILNIVALYDLHFRYDMIVTGARIHDGLGTPPFVGTLAVRGDRIVGVWHGHGPFLRPLARAVIHAGGLDLAPGFIDTHSHADQNIVSTSPLRIDNLVEQGVTTAILGNCGRSNLSANRLARHVTELGANINVSTLVGYNSARQAVMGTSTRPATANEIREICALISRDLTDGAVGLSTGFAYFPGRFASEEELLAALATTSAQGGIHASHIRDEGSGVVDAVNEAATLSASADVPLLISHLKITGPANCDVVTDLIAALRHNAAELSGRLYADIYPYVSSSTDLSLYLPDWFIGATRNAQARILRQPDERARLKEAIRARLKREGFDSLAFMTIASSARASWNGRSIAAVAASTSLDAHIDTVLEVLSRGGAQVNYRNICASAATEFIRTIPTMFGTDSAIRHNGDGATHPRGWGTFPRVLGRVVRSSRLLTLDAAIQRMTSLPAAVFGLTDRGVLGPGYFADLVLFDAAIVEDRATYATPLGRPVGIYAVWVNAAIVGGAWRETLARFCAAPTLSHAGRFLRRERPARQSIDITNGSALSTGVPISDIDIESHPN